MPVPGRPGCPRTRSKCPLKKYETGKLVYGDSNPEQSGYNSLADFYSKGENLEIRIPWQLLNVMDPSTRMIMDDLHRAGIEPVKTSGLYAGVGLIRDNKTAAQIEMKGYQWAAWDLPAFHERLKPSYFILQSAFAQYPD